MVRGKEGIGRSKKLSAVSVLCGEEGFDQLVFLCHSHNSECLFLGPMNVQLCFF